MKTKNTGSQKGYEIYYKNSSVEDGDGEFKYYLNVASNPYGLGFTPESFGFFSSHFLHGCLGIGRFDLKDIKIRYRRLY